MNQQSNSTALKEEARTRAEMDGERNRKCGARIDTQRKCACLEEQGRLWAKGGIEGWSRMMAGFRQEEGQAAQQKLRCHGARLQRRDHLTGLS